MFWNKKSNIHSFGAPLADLMLMLQPTSNEADRSAAFNAFAVLGTAHGSAS